MYIKRYIKIIFERTGLHLKSLGKMTLIPVFVLDLLLPVYTYMSYKKYGVSDEMLLNIQEITLMLIPLFSVWWVIFMLKEYVDSDGNELLYVNRFKNKLTDAVMLFLLYFLNVLVIFIIYSIMFKEIWILFIIISEISLFFFGLSYFLLFVSGSIITPLAAVIIIIALNYTLKLGKAFVPIYRTMSLYLVPQIIISYTSFAVMGIIFIIAGYFINKKALRFN